MDAKSAQVAIICECIDHCFAFAMWCDDFAWNVDPDDMVMGLDRAFDLVSRCDALAEFFSLAKIGRFSGRRESKAG
jgi:hypothetical protein